MWKEAAHRLSPLTSRKQRKRGKPTCALFGHQIEYIVSCKLVFTDICLWPYYEMCYQHTIAGLAFVHSCQITWLMARMNRSQNTKYLPDTLRWVWAVQRHHAVRSDNIDRDRPHLLVVSVIVEKPGSNCYDVNIPLRRQFTVKLGHARKYCSVVHRPEKVVASLRHLTSPLDMPVWHRARLI